MDYRETTVKIGDVWPKILVVTSDRPEQWDGPVITREHDGIVTRYYTAGLFREYREDDRYFYWFIYNEKLTLQDGESEAYSRMRQALDIVLYGEESQ